MNNSIEQLVYDIHESFSNNDFEKTVSMVADDAVIEVYSLGATFRGKNEFIQFMQGFKGAFPDMRIHHKNVFSNGNNVVVEFNATATHTGNLHTPNGIIPPTGKSINLTVCEVQVWENGKVKSIHNYQDSGSLMLQLGVMG